MIHVSSVFFFFSSRRRHTRYWRDWSSDVCSSDLSLQTFGGPAGQIAVMQRTLVDDKRWIGQRRFLHAMNYCKLLPRPEAPQLATYVRWRLHGPRGGLVAGGRFVLPGGGALLGLFALYGRFRPPLGG